MHHEYIDKYSKLNSVIHRLNPKLKLILMISLVFLISFSPSLIFVLHIVPLIFLFIFLSKVPLKFVIKRSFICLPFLIYILFLPFGKAMLVITKTIIAVMTVVVFISTTPFSTLLNILKEFRLPKTFLLMLSFFYRYIFLFIEIGHRMYFSLISRNFSKKNYPVLFNLLGSLIVKSYEHSEKVYMAMLARGYDPNK